MIEIPGQGVHVNPPIGPDAQILPCAVSQMTAQQSGFGGSRHLASSGGGHVVVGEDVGVAMANWTPRARAVVRMVEGRILYKR